MQRVSVMFFDIYAEHLMSALPIDLGIPPLYPMVIRIQILVELLLGRIGVQPLVMFLCSAMKQSLGHLDDNLQSPHPLLKLNISVSLTQLEKLYGYAYSSKN